MSDDLRALEMLIAEKLMHYRLAPVGKDYDGKNEGEVLVPPDWGGGGGFTYPPRGPIARSFHVPKWGSSEERSWELIRWMQHHGTGLDLYWGEDNNHWEVAWITGGKRYCGYDPDLKIAVLHAAANAARREEQDW